MDDHAFSLCLGHCHGQQVLTSLALLTGTIYLLYWYKSTITDAAGAQGGGNEFASGKALALGDALAPFNPLG